MVELGSCYCHIYDDELRVYFLGNGVVLWFHVCGSRCLGFGCLSWKGEKDSLFHFRRSLFHPGGETVS